MSAKVKWQIGGWLAAFGVLFIAVWLRGHNFEVLHPAGLIAGQQRHLFAITALLSLVVIVPVFVMTAVIAWRYRASNPHARYTPNWDHHAGIELVWWGVPGLIITILAVITWQSSHQLDPFRPLNVATRPLSVQVIALNWKWLFIYPEQHIATVNYLRLPDNTPINFRITSDATMNSFWIPQLGGQIYAMPGMSTQLHLLASQPGTYRGSSANISGSGFAGMHFAVQAVPTNNFETWVTQMQQAPQSLDWSHYQELAQPSQNVPPSYFSAVTPKLYDTVVAKYMVPGIAGQL